MEKELRFSYDQEGDILEIFKGKPKEAIPKDVGDDIWIRVDPETYVEATLHQHPEAWHLALPFVIRLLRRWGYSFY